MSYVKELVSGHIEYLKKEEEFIKVHVLSLEEQLDKQNSKLRELQDKRSELERFIKQ